MERGKSLGHRADRESRAGPGLGSVGGCTSAGDPTPAPPAARTTPSRDPWLSPALVEGLPCAGPFPLPLVAQVQPPLRAAFPETAATQAAHLAGLLPQQGGGGCPQETQE